MCVWVHPSVPLYCLLLLLIFHITLARASAVCASHEAIKKAPNTPPRHVLITSNKGGTVSSRPRMRSIPTCFHHITVNIQFTSAENMQYFFTVTPLAHTGVASGLVIWACGLCLCVCGDPQPCREIYRELQTPINGQTVEE